jgi:hypothetical protein
MGLAEGRPCRHRELAAAAVAKVDISAFMCLPRKPELPGSVRTTVRAPDSVRPAHQLEKSGQFVRRLEFAFDGRRENSEVKRAIRDFDTLNWPTVMVS